MKVELLNLLRCPVTREPLTLESPEPATGDIQTGWLVARGGQRRYPIRGGIPRFVSESNYADNFGMQWNQFRTTQLDSHSGHAISAERFWSFTQWRPEDIRGKWILDAGCGAGRFAEIALQAGAKVVAIDLSNAVEACYANLRQYDGLHVVQANLYELPFGADTFPFMYSMGVLQHTPDVEKAFRALPPLLLPGGRICVDYYPKTWKSALLPKYFLRPITKRVPKPMLFSVLKKVVPALLPVNRAFATVPVAGIPLKRLIPIVDYHGELPLTKQQHEEWALLDTFDMLAPEYDNPQTMKTARRWMEESGLRDVEVVDMGLVVARGRK